METRAGHADRERVIDALLGHCGDGRLTQDEFEDRVRLALAARTFGDLTSITADLPGPPARDECSAAAFVHLSAFCALAGVPFGNLAGPLTVWLAKRTSAFVDRHGRAALNFQLSLTIYIASLVAIWAAGVHVAAVVLMGMAMFVFAAAVTLAAGMRANAGEQFDYPLAIPFLRIR